MHLVPEIRLMRQRHAPLLAGNGIIGGEFWCYPVFF